jgi:DNA-binding transcriptional regulator/RsmH inhibitor MraZ
MTIYLMFSRTYEMPMLKVITEEGYEERVAIVERSSLSEARKRHKLGVLASLCRDASINDQGKLTIPKDLAEAVGIAPDSDVVLVGRRGHFEVWEASSAQRARDIEMAEPDEEELGIF